MKSWVPIGSLFLSMEVPISLENSVKGVNTLRRRLKTSLQTNADVQDTAFQVEKRYASEYTPPVIQPYAGSLPG